MSLITLPTELVEHVALHADCATLQSIRLSCWSLTRQTLRIFKVRFFRKRRLRWTKGDFDILLSIAGHSELGSALQHLTIDATPRHSINLWHTRKRLSEAQAIFGPYHASSAKSPLEQKYAEDGKVAEDVATFFTETRYDQKCLSNIFAKLGDLDSIVFEYEGMDKKYSKFGRRYCESSQLEMSRPFVSTMAAIAASKICVKAISLHHIHNHGAVSIGRLESLAPLLRNFDSAFEKLEVLNLNLRDWRFPDAGFELDTRRAPFVVRFLAKAKNIKVLNLSCYSSLEEDLLGEMARHCIFTRLERCKLSLFKVNNAADLTTFLDHSSNSLESLSLHHMVLRDEDSTWPQILRQLALCSTTLPALEEVELVNLFSRMGSGLMYDEFGEKTRVTVGVKGTAGKWRVDLLDRVNGFAEGSSGPAWHLSAVAYPFVGLRT